MSDEVVSTDTENPRAAPGSERASPPAVGEDQLEALRKIVFGKRLEDVERLRGRVAELRTALVDLESRADRGDESVARELAERTAAIDALTTRLGEAEAAAQRIEASTLAAVAEQGAAAEALAQRVDAAEALAERIEGAGGLTERVDHVESIAARVEGIDTLDERVGQVEQVSTRVVDEDIRAEDLGEVLPRAVAMRARKDGQLAAALRPTIENTLEASVRRNPQALVDIIFPVLGPAIRKMIGSAITSMVGSINRAVESSFTLRGLQWRMQAWRTKRSYAEIALMHGLVYRVEELFLIQRESGLLLAHATRGKEAQEPEAISGMLTAITDFVRDSFNVGSGSEVETFRVGDLTLIVKGGPQAVLAATVRGVAPPSLHDDLETTIEQVHRDYGRAIKAYDGNADALAGIEGLLEPRLVEEAKERKQRGPASLIFWVLLALVLATIATSVITNRMRAARVERDVRAFARTLSAESGIVVTGVHAEEDRWVIEGLRDPLARDPAEPLTKSGLDPQDVELRIAAFRSLELPFVQQRLAQRVDPPATVTLTWRDRTLVVTGRSPNDWVTAIRALVAATDGTEGVDLDGLVIDPVLDRAETLRLALRQRPYPVSAGVSNEDLADVRAALTATREAAGSLYGIQLVVIALARQTEDEPAARALADQIVARLRKAGVESSARILDRAALAQPKPGQPVPRGDAAEIRFDLYIRSAEDAGR